MVDASGHQLTVHRGVHWDAARAKWSASYIQDGTMKHVGHFENDELAAKAIDEHVRRWKGKCK